MGSFSTSHWLIVLAIVVLLFGAKKIPDLAKGLGQGIRNFKKEMKEEDTPATPEAPKQVDTVATTGVEAPKTHTQA
ncbi:MAG: twin-arginine translocase TatA/TatE family subunit [Sulfuricurvum sp.]|uniref:twin-arginine translocase TatA/TatE family subunit n=1 Tax=Sulfuricurvum sp. TaxID=2025608 RepID=UPI00260E5E48|nr:twin-arginine translocase TatA/TatE family subunit [Sulfuricurvum sp.]MDD2828201.1 twin-arginine translocase TatA/TatE family subunit [Sulfuricurvum sp.]MDD4949844.1 twin-arginine translocase TatA/TatE family subunit [Sulfuricurvum sp.]